MKNFCILLLLSVLVVLSGCGNKVRLSGTVTFSDDGSPVPTGKVCFEQGDFFASGDIQPDGTYTVGTNTSNDGIPPGTYQVYVGAAVKEVERLESGDAVTVPLVAEKFTGPTTSGLTIEVTRSTKNYDFQVDRF